MLPGYEIPGHRTSAGFSPRKAERSRKLSVGRRGDARILQPTPPEQRTRLRTERDTPESGHRTATTQAAAQAEAAQSPFARRAAWAYSAQSLAG